MREVGTSGWTWDLGLGACIQGLSRFRKNMIPVCLFGAAERFSIAALAPRPINRHPLPAGSFLPPKKHDPAPVCPILEAKAFTPSRETADSMRSGGTIKTTS